MITHLRYRFDERNEYNLLLWYLLVVEAGLRRMCILVETSRRVVGQERRGFWRGHLCIVIDIEGNIQPSGDYSNGLIK